MAVTDAQSVWLGLNNGLIQKINTDGEVLHTIEDYRGRQITALNARNDTLFVGLDIGLSIFLISMDEVRETYRALGTTFQVEIPVRDILLRGAEIWAATDEGVASSRLDYVNLLDPQSWTDYGPGSGIPPGDVRRLISFESTLYAATSSGLGAWDGLTWESQNTYDIFDVCVYENRLTISTTQGILFRSVGGWESLPFPPKTIHYLALCDGSLYGGTDRGIVSYSDGDTAWIILLPNCIGSNLISDVGVDESGTWWCTSRDEGFFSFDGFNWTPYDRDSFFYTSTYDFTSVESQSSGDTWLGNWGSGLVRLDLNGSVRHTDPKMATFPGSLKIRITAW